MRIISGKYKSRLIKMPKGIRPTQNKVRKALFDILGDVSGLSFLELFAGSGAVGLEAASQGAKEVVFVEKGPQCAEIIKENLSVIGLLRDSVIAADVLEVIKRFSQNKKKFDIIFIDPPYYQELSKKTLQLLGPCDILARYGLVIVQHFKKDLLPDNIGKLTRFKQATYAGSALSFYKKNVPKSNISRDL